MNHRPLLSVVTVLSFVLAPISPVFADAQGDLAAGRKALMDGNPDASLPLLKSAAEGLPQSVEAQFALGQCYLQLGELDKAATQFRAVLKLSPKHERATRLVAALSGRVATFDQTMAAARSLFAAGAHTSAGSLLRDLLKKPLEDAQRTSARLLSAELNLWSYKPPLVSALTGAVQLINEGGDANVTGPAKVIAALAAIDNGQVEAAQGFIKDVDVDKLPAQWKARAQLVGLVAKLKDDTDHADVSVKLPGPLAQIPESAYRQRLMSRLASQLVAAAHEAVGRGDSDTAISIVWPMFSNKALPEKHIFVKLPISGGWVTEPDAWYRAVGVLSAIGQAEIQAVGQMATLPSYWIAAEAVDKAPPGSTAKQRADQTLMLIEQLSGLSRSPAERLKGSSLSRADAIQAQLIVRVAGSLTSEKQRDRLVSAVTGYINRYNAVDDLESGLFPFARPKNADGGKFALDFPLDTLRAGNARKRFLTHMAGQYGTLGHQKFQKAASTLDPAANASVNEHDSAALFLYHLAVKLSPTDKPIMTAADAIVNRYAGAEKWDAATTAITAFHAGLDGSSQRWATIQLKIARAHQFEHALLNTQRKLPAALSALVKEAVTDAAQILIDHPKKANRNRLINLANNLVVRYARLNRRDLAEAVIAAANIATEVARQLPPVAIVQDWAHWIFADLADARARSAVARAAKQVDPGAITLDQHHKNEIALLGLIVTGHPNSDYAPAAVDRLVKIARVYRSYTAFDVAGSVIGDFIKAHPKISSAERLEYELALVKLTKAQYAFAKREDKVATPAKVSDEYDAAIKALSAFLKAHPTGDHAAAAERELLTIARTYGGVGAWPVVREVLKQIATAIPDFRSPGQLRLYEAATYLGELDRNYALSLLSPPPPQSLAPPPSRLALNTPGGYKLETRKIRSGPVGSVAGGGGVRLGDDAKPGAPDSPVAIDPAAELPAVIPQTSDTALAMIRRSEQQQLARLASIRGQTKPREKGGQQALAMPGGPVLSEAAIKSQDEAADKAYAILIALIKGENPDHAIADKARMQVLWMIGFLEGQLRHSRAIVMIRKYLTDRANDPERIALAYRAVNDQLSYAAHKRPTDRVNQAWVDEHHERFEKARADIDAFIKQHADKKDWVNKARLLAFESYQSEARLVTAVSPVRAGGLLVQGAEQLLILLNSVPDHPDAANFPQRLWSIADQLGRLNQREQAIYILSRVNTSFPTHTLASQSVLRIAQIYEKDLWSPLRAVETYQEYLNVAPANPKDAAARRQQIFEVASRLVDKRRYVEALHIYNVFVDSFPTDARAAQALQAIGRIHQTNEVWSQAIASYQRVIDEYNTGAGAKLVPSVKFAIAECQINLSQWRKARLLYDEYLKSHKTSSQAKTALARIDVLKNLDRYQKLLDDPEVTRNKDDAQFQIGRIVLERLRYTEKAIREFRKVVVKHAKSHLADDAQLEIGKAYLALGRMDEARAELLKVPADYPGSPQADNALYMIGQSYEQQAKRLATVTVQLARAEAYERGQRFAYQATAEALKKDIALQSDLQKNLKAQGKRRDFDLNSPNDNIRISGRLRANIINQSRAAEVQAETESALEVANRQDKINDAYRNSVAMYVRAATEYPLGDQTSESLLRMAEIYESQLKDRVAAMETYQKVVKFFPGTPVAEDAAWQVARFHEEEEKFKEAVDAYRDFIRNYPASKRVADAQYAMAEALEQLGRWVEAMDAYQTFREKFAKHPKSNQAQEQINWIKAYRR